MSLHSYHIFYFAFKWSLPSKENKLFSEQVDLNNIPILPNSMWERVQLNDKEPIIPLNETDLKEDSELFGERQYYFDFVHPVLYDIKGKLDSLIHHYERREPKLKDVRYVINVKDKSYELRLDAINLNLYSTGVGIMSFYLANEKESQSDEYSIRDINQFGRRIMPPHCGEFTAENRCMIASSIMIKGLEGRDEKMYEEKFDYKIIPHGDERGFADVWQPALFIKRLREDLSTELNIIPIIDDRMLVNCWYTNDKLSKQAASSPDEFMKGDFWYKYLFVDEGNDKTCQNDEMEERLTKASTYSRWQKYGTMYGVSRYSFVALTPTNYTLPSMHMRTIYSRMFELIIIQRASMLRFSGEVTKVSSLIGVSNKQVALRIGSLYKEYIKFVNQIYFRSVTVQDQGIELYEMLMKQFSSGEKIKELDDEIGELYQYITLMVDQNRNDNGEKLNLLAAAFLPATLLTGIFGMNESKSLEGTSEFWWHILFIGIVSLICYYIIKKWRK